MSLIAALFLAPSGVVGTVPVRNIELDAAHACLKAGAERLLSEGRSEPTKETRWNWALTIADGCKDEINAAADSKEAVVVRYPDTSFGGITKRHMLRSEALYFVDGMIRDHFESKAK